MFNVCGTAALFARVSNVKRVSWRGTRSRSVSTVLHILVRALTGTP